MLTTTKMYVKSCMYQNLLVLEMLPRGAIALRPMPSCWQNILSSAHVDIQPLHLLHMHWKSRGQPKEISYGRENANWKNAFLGMEDNILSTDTYNSFYALIVL